jgi:hypothetical protein
LDKHLSTPQSIDGTALRRRHQPRSGISRDIFLEPSLKGRNERVLR